MKKMTFTQFIVTMLCYLSSSYVFAHHEHTLSQSMATPIAAFTVVTLLIAVFLWKNKQLSQQTEANKK